MLESELDYPDAHVYLYGVAAAQGDAAEMRRQVAGRSGKVGIEDILLAEQADTEAFYGRLSEAREFSRRAIESAQRAGKRETAALWQMNEALREAEFGNWQVARHGAAAALALASTRDVQTLAALMLAQSGDASQAQKMSDDLARRYPLDTLINGIGFPPFALPSNLITTTLPKPSSFSRGRPRTNSEPYCSRPNGLHPSIPPM